MRMRRILSSRRLTCGCLAGIYETSNGRVVTIIDDHSPSCPSPDHRLGRAVTPGHEMSGTSPYRSDNAACLV